MKTLRVWLASVAVVALLWGGTLAAAGQMPGSGRQMPDPKQLSGIPLPLGDMPAGSIMVRVIRGQLTKPITKQTVELSGPGIRKTAATDEAGRAQFNGLTPGSRLKATTTVAGEKLESREFDVPAAGGIKMMLVATDPDTEKRAADDRRLAQEPPVPGMVVLGDQSRFVVELGDDGLSVFNILQVMNTARRAVETEPLVFDLPPAASGASVLEGSAPNTVAAGKRITVSGPFPPGATAVQFAYSIPYGSESMTIEQRMPVAVAQVSVLAQRTPSMHLTSPQVKQTRDMNEEGESYILAQGPALKAGDVVSLTFTGLPHHPAWPRNLALAIAVAILGAGAWAAARGPLGARSVEARRRKLKAERDALFAELTSIEQQCRRGTIDDAEYAERRRELVASLEGIYAAIDEEAAA